MLSRTRSFRRTSMDRVGVIYRYQRITSILKRFSDSIEETRISLRNGSSSVLGYGMNSSNHTIEESVSTTSILLPSPFLWSLVPIV